MFRDLGMFQDLGMYKDLEPQAHPIRFPLPTPPHPRLGPSVEPSGIRFWPIWVIVGSLFGESGGLYTLRAKCI